MLFPPLVIFAPLGSAPVLVVAALAITALAWRRIRATLRPMAPLVMLLGALGLWGLCSASWSIIPAHSALEGLRFLAESGCGLALLGAAESADPIERQRIGQALGAGIGIALLLLAIERFGGEPITHWFHHSPETQYEPLTRFDRGVTVLVLLIWPLLLARLMMPIRALLIGLIIGAAFVMSSAAALFAALASFAVFAVARFAPRLVAGAMILGLVALGIGIPLAAPNYATTIALHAEAPWIKWSGIHRLLIWRFGADRVAERPILGWGMDASRAMPGGKTDFNDLLPTLHYPSHAEAMPLHPHDAALQWQLELGIPGLLLGLAIVVWVIHRAGWQDALAPKRRASALALTAAALVIGLLSFGVWQAWWLSTLWLSAVLTVATGGEPEMAAMPAARRSNLIAPESASKT